MCVKGCVLFVMYWYKQIQNKLINRIENNVPTVFRFELFLMDFVMWANSGVYIIIPAVQVKHTFFLKCFFPVYPIVDTWFC